VAYSSASYSLTKVTSFFFFLNFLSINIKSLPIDFLVFLKLLDLVSNLLSSWFEKVLKGIISSLNINDGILNLDFQVSHLRVMLISSNIVVVL